MWEPLQDTKSEGSTKMSAEEAINQIREAIRNEGPNPGAHREVMGRHRREWPTLWHAIDALLALPPSDTKETR